MELQNLIKSITPLYNQYKKDKNKILPYKSIELMWEIGSLLLEYINKHDIKPHSLYRMIYGKSEGTSYITQKSYITREFQGRCFRIYKMFSSQNEIQEQLPSLNSFTNFRECMPFFDNPKYILKGKEKIALLDLLNSNLKPSIILKKIRQLQKQKIGISNTRNQRLVDLDKEKNVFIDFYNHTYRLLKENNFSSISKNLNKDYYLALYQNTLAMCQDGIKYHEFKIVNDISEIEKKYGEMLHYFIKRKTAKEVRRFRKLIPSERISRLSEMIFALTDEKLYNSF
tara:strand:- start:93 stop:944 length:852 start_codon:yes stop_codon:yes gene_type:complete